MTCRCGNRQCFVCSQNVSYDHFTDAPGGCPMYCDVDQLFDREVTQAKRETVRKLKQKKPDLKEEEIVPNVPNLPRMPQQQHMPMRAYGYPEMVPMGPGMMPPTIIIPPPPPPFILPAGLVSPFGNAPHTPPMFHPPPYNPQQYWPPYQYPNMNMYPPIPPPGNWAPPAFWNPYPTPPPINGMPMFPAAALQQPQVTGTRITHPNAPVSRHGQQKQQAPRAAPMQNVNYGLPRGVLGEFPPPERPTQTQGRNR